MNLKMTRLYVAVCIICYLLISLHDIGKPGPYYDELLFVNGARHDSPDNTMQIAKVGRIPVMLIPYIGALKAYLYYPVFRIFGIDLWTIRTPVILITALSLLLIFLLLRKIFSPGFALVTLTILAFDPSLIYMTRLDYGPNALELFLKCLSAFFFYRYFLEGKSLASLAWGLFCLALGIFNKLNFIWYANSLFALTFLFKFSAIKTAVLQRDFRALRPYLMIVTAFFVFVLWLLTINKLYGVLNSFSSGSASYSMDLKLSALRKIPVGTNYLDVLYGEPETQWTRMQLILYLVVIFCAGLVQLFFPGNSFVKANRGKWIFLVLMILFHIVQIFITREAVGAWHSFTIYPFFPILLVCSVLSIGSLFIVPAEGKLISLVLIAGILAYNGNTISRYFRMFGTRTARMQFSEKATDLVKITKAHKGNCVSIDWGLHNILIAGDGKKGKYTELTPFFMQDPMPDQKEWIKSAIIEDTMTLFITHPPGKELIPDVTRRFDAFTDSLGFQKTAGKMINDGENDVYLLYKLKRKIVSDSSERFK